MLELGDIYLDEPRVEPEWLGDIANPLAGQIPVWDDETVFKWHPSNPGMADTYVQNTVSAIFNASYSTLFASTGAVVQLLAQRPDVLERLRDPALMATGVDELVRFTAPAQGTSRVATR